MSMWSSYGGISVRRGLLVLFALSGLILIGCGTEAEPEQPLPTDQPIIEPTPTDRPEPTVTGETMATVPEEEVEPTMDFELTSTAFTAEESIPSRFTCDADNLSPDLSWGDPPEGTQSFVLIMDDPDAPYGTWVHWVLFNLPGELRGLPEGIGPEAEFGDGSRHGSNSWERLGYGGPCPPEGKHRYFFKLYAVDFMLDIQAGASKAQILEVIEGHVLAEAELMGTYTR